MKDRQRLDNTESKREQTACPFCGSTAAWFLDATDRNRGIHGHFRYYRCGSCALIFISPVPENLGDYYKDGYQKIPRNLDELRQMAEPERYRLEPIFRFHKRGKLLEVGPWIGLFSCVAKDAGFDVTAIEINQECVRFLNETLGILAVQSNDPATTLTKMNECFDVIALWHSIEHLPSPWKLVRQAANRLTSGGILLVATPNPDSSQIKVLRELWYHLDAPRHLYFMPATLLEEIGRQEGLETVLFTTTDTLGRILDRDAWNACVGHYVRVRGVRRLVAYGVTPILRWLYQSYSEGKGAGYTLVLRQR